MISPTLSLLTCLSLMNSLESSVQPIVLNSSLSLPLTPQHPSGGGVSLVGVASTIC